MKDEEKQRFDYNNSPFENSNGYVHNLYQHDIRLVEMLVVSKDEQIRFLKEEVARLRQQNDFLIQKFTSK